MHVKDINLRSNVELNSVWYAYVMSCHKRILRNAFILLRTFSTSNINMDVSCQWAWERIGKCIIQFMSYLCLFRYNIQNNGFKRTPHSSYIYPLNRMIKKKSSSFFSIESQVERVIVLQIN